MSDKMQVILVLALVFALLVAVFAISNAEKVNIRFFGVVYNISQAIVILGAAVFGAIVTLLLGLFSRVRMLLKIREFRLKIADLEKQLEEARKEIERLQKASLQSGKDNIPLSEAKN
jgi:uncharacterized integral membrane protein